MARAGRKRKTTVREPNGRPQRTYERVSPTPELERKKARALGDLATHTDLDDLPGHHCASGWITHDMWRAASRLRGLFIRAFGRVDAKPGALAGLIPDPDRGYRTDDDSQAQYLELLEYVRSRGGARSLGALYQYAVLRRQPPRMGLAIEALKHLLEGEKVLAKRREFVQPSEMQAQQVGLAG